MIDIRAVQSPSEENSDKPQGATQQNKCFHGFVHKIPPKLHMFEFGEKIGTGSCGEVFKAKCATDRKCDIAIKVIPLITWKANRALNEKKTIESVMNNPHINFVEYYGFLEEKDKLYIFMELGNGNLKDFMEKNISSLSIAQFNEIVFQVLEIINHLHSKRIVHNNLKMDNLLCFKKSIKLVDFGFNDLNVAQDFEAHLFILLWSGSLFLAELQFEIKIQSKAGADYKPLNVFSRAAQSKTFSETDAKDLFENKSIWHEELPLQVKRILSRCFINQSAVSNEILKERFSIPNRAELDF